MSQVAIVSDSVTGLSEKTLAENGIRVVSMGFILDKKVYRDYVDIKNDAFWEMFPGFKEIPTTSACSPGDFYDAFMELSTRTDKIVCITISNKLSATHKAALQAAEMARSENSRLDIKVIDSKTSSGGLGWTVLEAARAAREGKNQEAVVERAQDMISRVKYFIMLESMRYILKVARAPDSQGQPTPTNISPIMGIVKPDIGVMENLDRTANIDEALLKAADLVKNYIDPGNPVHFLLTYPDKIDKCEKMGKALAEKYQCAEMIFGQWPPSAIVAAGPMYGLAFYT
jgi:DegV family protein with EDD domain